MVCATDDGGAGSSVAGSDTQVQFNSGGGFAAAASFTFASSSGKLAVPYACTTATHRKRHRIFQRAFRWSTRSRECAPYRIRRHGYLDSAFVRQSPRRQRPRRLRPPRHIVARHHRGRRWHMGHHRRHALQSDRSSKRTRREVISRKLVRHHDRCPRAGSHQQVLRRLSRADLSRLYRQGLLFLDDLCGILGFHYRTLGHNVFGLLPLPESSPRVLHYVRECLGRGPVQVGDDLLRLLEVSQQLFLDHFHRILGFTPVPLGNHVFRLLGEREVALGYYVVGLLAHTQPGRGLLDHERELPP